MYCIRCTRHSGGFPARCLPCAPSSPRVGATSCLPRPRLPTPCSRSRPRRSRSAGPPRRSTGPPPACARSTSMPGPSGASASHELVRLADRTEVNAFVVDVKDDTGYLTYRSEVPTAIEIGANQQLRARDTRERLRIMREHGIFPIARIVVAKDPLLASKKPEWSVQHVDGGLWRDRLDFAWVDAFNDSIWVYAAELAAEAVRHGIRRGAVRLRAIPRRAREQAGERPLPRSPPGRDQAPGRDPQPPLAARADQAARRAVHHRRLRPHHQRAGRHGDRAVLGGSRHHRRRGAADGVPEPLRARSVQPEAPQQRARTR